MKPKLHIPWLTAASLLCAAGSARANLIETVPFSLAVGPSKQTIALPQFNSALGTLTGATISIAGTIQYVVDVFNTGAGSFSGTVEDTLSFGATPILAGGTFSGAIPANQTVFAYSPPPMNFGPLTETFDAATGGFLVGAGTVAFDLTLPAVKVDSFSGATVLNILSFSGAAGNVTADYMYVPAVTAAPEPGSLTTLGIALLCLYARRRK
jgi:hypothetical protein